jgi:hypothetical protein
LQDTPSIKGKCFSKKKKKKEKEKEKEKKTLQLNFYYNGKEK